MIIQKNLITAVLVVLAIGAGMILGQHRTLDFRARFQSNPESMANVMSGHTGDAALGVYKAGDGANSLEQFVRIADDAGVPDSTKMHRLSEFLGSLDRDAMHAFLTAMNDAPGELVASLNKSLSGRFIDDGWWTFLIYSRWAELEDIAAALAFIDAEEIEMDPAAMLTVWGMRHPDQALEYADELTEGERLYLTTGVALSIARNAPLKALRFLEDAGLEIDELGGSPHFVEWTNPENFVPRDTGETDEMIRHIHGQYADRMKWAIEQLQGSLYAALAKHDPSNVVERLAALDDGLLGQVINAMSGRSSTGDRADFLWRSGMREPFSEQQKNLIHAMLSIDQNDPFSARPSISTIDGMVKWINAIASADVRREFAEVLANSIPPAVGTEQVLTSLLGEAPQLPVNDIGFQDLERAWEMLVEAAGSKWAGQESIELSPDWMLHNGAENALSRALSLPPGTLRDRVLNTLASGLSTGAPATIEALIDSVPESDESGRTALVLGLAASDPLRAIELLTSGEIPASPNASGAFQEAAKNWVTIDAESALPWLIEHRDSLPDQVFEKSGVVNALADRDIGAALELVETMARESNYAEVTSQSFSIWSQTHPAEVSAYIDAQMEPGPARDQAVGALVNQLQRYDSVSAKRWAETIQDNSVKESVLRSLR